MSTATLAKLYLALTMACRMVGLAPHTLRFDGKSITIHMRPD